MPSFVVVPARPDDIEAIARLQFESCSTNPGFRTIFPKGASPAAVQHVVSMMEKDMDEDQTAHFMIVKDGLTGEVVSYAIWNFITPRKEEEIEAEMLKDAFPWPEDANAEAGNTMMHNTIRKKHEVLAKWFGMGSPYACMLGLIIQRHSSLTRTDLSVIGTSAKHRKQGAASLLVKWGTERADDYNLPSYLEASKAGYNLYRKYGFAEVDNLAIEISRWGGEDFVDFCMIRPAKS
jgi:predicted GNAT family N-acyltransferase